MKLTEQVKAARRVATPLIAVNTPDPAATITQLCEAINGSAPKLEWDVVRSFHAINTEGRFFISHTKLHGAFTLRVAIGNLRTTEQDIRDLWKEVQACLAVALSAS